jgi:hypothetical protein
MLPQSAHFLPSNTPPPSHIANTTDYPISILQVSHPSFVSKDFPNYSTFDTYYAKDVQLIIAKARESPPQDIEEATCFLALVRAEREVRRAEEQKLSLRTASSPRTTLCPNIVVLKQRRRGRG